MFDKYIYNKNEIGYYHQNSRCFYFFGNKNITKDQLPIVFPDFEFKEVHQVHGDKIVEANSEVQEADAIWTDKKNVALLIKTADCMPLLLEQGKKIMAIHAGWRGTYENILTKSIQSVFDYNEAFHMICGPSIQKKSFEVDRELAEKFSNKYKNIDDLYQLSNEDPKKAYLDLSKIIHQQLKNYELLTHHISDVDTLTEALYCSYRRDKSSKGRNYSFVARLDD